MDEDLPDTAEVRIIRDKNYLSEIVDLHHVVREHLPLNQKNYLLPKAAGYFFSAMNDPDKFIIAIIEENKLLGFAIMIIAETMKIAIDKKHITAPLNAASFNGKIAVLQSLCVDPFQKRRGVSKAIIQKAISIVASKNIKSLYAQVAVDNETCWGIFQAMGFRIDMEWTFEHRRYLLKYS